MVGLGVLNLGYTQPNKAYWDFFFIFKTSISLTKKQKLKQDV